MNNNKMALKSDKVDLLSIPKGKIYLVKASSDVLLWELRNLPNLKTLFSISIDTLLCTIQYPDFFSNSEENYLTVYHPKLNLPIDINISSRTRLFIWVPTIKGYGYSSNEESFFNKYKTDPYITLDLTNYEYNHDDYFFQLSNTCLSNLSSIDNLSIPIVLEEYKKHPIKLNYLLSQPSLLVNTSIVVDIITITNLIAKLAVPNPSYSIVKQLQNFPKTTLNQLVVNPKTKFTLLYKIIKGVYTYKNSPNTSNIESINCPSLWLWFELMITRLNPNYYRYPELIIKLFFTWVVNCNKRFSSASYRGFHSYIKYKKITYLFEPSEEAIKAFYRLF